VKKSNSFSKYGDLRFNNIFYKIVNNIDILNFNTELNLFKKTILNKLDDYVDLFSKSLSNLKFDLDYYFYN
jgi:hypothetical protein